MPRIELTARELRERTEREFQVFDRIERARFILGVEIGVAFCEGTGVDVSIRELAETVRAVINAAA